MQHPNLYLKSCFILKDGSLTESCRKMEMDYNRLSRIINRRVEAKSEEMRQIAWYLQKSMEELFGEAKV